MLIIYYLVVTMIVIYIDAATSVATETKYNFLPSVFLSLLWPATVPVFIWHANKESGK